MEPMVAKKKAALYQEFAERLDTACSYMGLPERGRAKALGQLVGVGYKGAGKWLAGDGMPDMGHSSALAVALQVSFEWLMTGRGPISFTAGPAAVAEHGARYAVTESAEMIFKTMPPLAKTICVHFFDTLSAIIEDRPDVFYHPRSDRGRHKPWKSAFDEWRARFRK